MEIQSTTITADKFYLKSTFIYGASSSGKGVIISNIMYVLKDIIPIGFAFCPTDNAQGLYSKRTLPRLCVFDTINVEWLEKFWERQMASAELYRLVNRIEVFESLFKKIPNAEVSAKVAEIRKLAEKHMREAKSVADADEIKEKRDDALRIVYRSHVDKYINEYRSLDSLGKDELITINNYNFNPDALLVIDDLSKEFKDLCKCAFIGDMLTKGRHYRITLIVAIHGDNYVDKPLRELPMVTIFTTAAVIASFFGKLENFTPQQKRRIVSAIEPIFKDEKSYKKIIYIRNTNSIFSFKAEDKRMFENFGSPIIFEYCEKLERESNGNAINNELLGKNKFLQMMIHASTSNRK